MFWHFMVMQKMGMVERQLPSQSLQLMANYGMPYFTKISNSSTLPPLMQSVLLLLLTKPIWPPVFRLQTPSKDVVLHYLTTLLHHSSTLKSCFRKSENKQVNTRSIRRVINSVMEYLRIVMEPHFASHYEEVNSLFLTRIDDSRWAKRELGNNRLSQSTQSNNF